ncbi:unnamed protein product [Rotaria socialis]|uniref:Uncharacterized protein n=1 Tax=Rotaria socialis TaxID=392032 RepID=A0A818WKC9_9BILA|nr:unnamed protein product [Rotaria socialis]CAF4670556.1 unnamed protein product [Rotaria socialis]
MASSYPFESNNMMTTDDNSENNWTRVIRIPAHLKSLKYGANKYVLLLSFFSPYHLIGIGLLASLFLPTIVITVLSVICVIYPLTKQILRYYNFLQTPYSTDIIRSTYTARCDGDFVVCLIGIRPNGANPFTKSFIEAGNAFRDMLAELESNPTLGYMGGDIYVGANDRKSTTLVVQYWRDYESLERWTHTKMGVHIKTMLAYMKNDRVNGINGVWHETYKVKDGQYEAIYLNMPPMGLALATQAVHEIKTNNASERIQRRIKEKQAQSMLNTPEKN